ncbi:MAG: formylglycine-generating enzyme family protein [Candidatus Cloacimonetes bacterium]|nr:formylglycine-generating enzyme family protein [Candidatus Cloacimonadota bacterium]
MRKCLLCLMFICCMTMVFAQSVTNIRVIQDPELSYYTITFDLSGKTAEQYMITAIPYKTGNEISNPHYLTGKGIATPCSTGSDLAIFWNPTMEGLDKDGWQFRISARQLPKYFVLVEGGSFSMGSNDGGSDEKPVHQVTIASFYIGRYEITQKEWVDVMGSNPSNWKGDNLPVEKVSWYDAVNYCNIRSFKEGFKPCYNRSGDNITCDWKANGYRLPTEAEWEYAARGGKYNKGSSYSGSSDLGSVGWYSNNAGSSTHEVGTKAANELGIYDMSGNVWEWCWDWYNSGYYAKSQSSDPIGANSGSTKLLRGGSWSNRDNYSRVTNRAHNYFPDRMYNLIGFRVVRTP